MKGILGGDKGFLLPYNEVAEKLNIPKDYFLSDLDCWREEVIVQLVGKGFATGHKETVDFNCAKRQERYIFLKREDFEKRIGISFESRSALSVTLCCKDGARLRYGSEQFFLARELLGKESFVWICADVLENLDSEEFIEADWN